MHHALSCLSHKAQPPLRPCTEDLPLCRESRSHAALNPCARIEGAERARSSITRSRAAGTRSRRGRRRRDLSESGDSPSRGRALWERGTRECSADVRRAAERDTTCPFVSRLYGAEVCEKFRPLDLVTCELRSRRKLRRDGTSADSVTIDVMRGVRERVDERFRCDMHETGNVDGVQSVSERDEGGALREEHKQAIQTFEQIRVSVRLNKL
jgi:hypothetical protein